MLLALVATSLATLGVAGVVVLPPLEHRVESDRLNELRGLARTIRPELRDLPIRDRRRDSPALLRLMIRLQHRVGGRIVVYDQAGTELGDTVAAPAGEASELGDASALREAVLRRRDGLLAGRRGDVAYAMTVAGEPDRLTLVITKRLDDSRAAATVVRAALPLALVTGLAVSMLLALLLSRSLLRRLRRLQADAAALGAEGLRHQVLVTGHDEVTVVARALEQMRERLVEEQASRQEFVSTASHELRTPLASLQVTLELLREEALNGTAGAGALADRADAALRQTSRLTALATDLLDISRVDGGAPLAVEPVELNELAATIAQEFAPRLAIAGRALHLDGDPALALADPAAAARIVRVLLDNADRYGAGSVFVTVTPAPGRVILAVQDEGLGLAEGERERVFRRFARGRAAAGAAHGAGLGLAIARGLARSMDGDLVAAASETGARLVLELPAA
jgi:signal transduction histidine kinase